MEYICPICLMKKNGTQEHIVPYTLGGSLTIPYVCKGCNSEMGEKIDAPFVDAIYNRLGRLQFNISGRGGAKISCIYSGANGELPDCGAKFCGDRDGQPNIYQKINVEVSDKGIRVNAVFPPWSDQQRIYGAVKKAVLEALREKEPTAPQDFLERQAENVAKQTYGQGRVESTNKVILHDKIDLGIQSLEFVKIAYETAVHIFGEEYYVNSRTASILRGAIKLANGEACVHGQIFVCDKDIKEFLDKLAENTSHVIVVIGGKALISVFGVCAVICFEETDSRFMVTEQDARFYKLDFNERKCSEGKLTEWLEKHPGVSLFSS